MVTPMQGATQNHDPTERLIQTTISPEQHAQIADLAARLQVTPGVYLRAVIDTHLSQDQPTQATIDAAEHQRHTTHQRRRQAGRASAALRWGTNQP